MPIISVRDNENNRWKKNEKQQQQQQQNKTNTERNKGVIQAIVKVISIWVWVRVWFYYAVRFFQLICKASLIFKSKLEFALAINLKERELCESKHFVVKCGCLKL